MNRLKRDDVTLAFQEVGSGALPVLLVHGWACDHSFLAPQLAFFGRAHRSVAVDLRGHGMSDAPEQNYTMAGFADDLAGFLVGDLEGGLVSRVVVAVP